MSFYNWALTAPWSQEPLLYCQHSTHCRSETNRTSQLVADKVHSKFTTTVDSLILNKKRLSMAWKLEGLKARWLKSSTAWKLKISKARELKNSKALQLWKFEASKIWRLGSSKAQKLMWRKKLLNAKNLESKRKNIFNLNSYFSWSGGKSETFCRRWSHEKKLGVQLLSKLWLDEWASHTVPR